MCMTVRQGRLQLERRPGDAMSPARGARSAMQGMHFCFALQHLVRAALQQ